MSYLEDFEQWKDRIEAVPLDDVKVPNRPVDEMVARTEALAVSANEDREALMAAGLDVDLIDQLTTLSGALRYSQAQWMSNYQAREEAQTQWFELSPEAYALHERLLHDFSFAYRGDANILKKVMRIREGSSQADMVQDLPEIAALGKKYPELLQTINFDFDLLAQAETSSHTLSEILAITNGTTGESNKSKVLRDKAFTLLDKVDSTIREYGRYVFWKDANKKENYKL